jgi:nucleoside 2-deoxyribosyltransferase
MIDSMKTLYVGCALRGAPAPFVESVLTFKGELEKYFTVLHFIGLVGSAPAREVYEADIACASEADLMLAVVDVPSTGLGIELAKRAELGKPTIIAHQERADISKMVLGLAEVTPAFTIITYTNFSELKEQIRAFA